MMRYAGPEHEPEEPPPWLHYLLIGVTIALVIWGLLW